MEGIEYLRRGDLKKLASSLGISTNHVRRVHKGESVNIRIKTALEKLIQKRKEEVENFSLKEFDTDCINPNQNSLFDAISV